MKIAKVEGMVQKFMVAGLVAGAFMLAGAAQADAQQFAVGVEFGHPAYVASYDGYRRDRDDWHHDPDRFDREDYRRQQEFRERQEREEFLRRQEYLRHEQYEQHEQWERYHGDDRPYGYR